MHNIVPMGQLSRRPFKTTSICLNSIGLAKCGLLFLCNVSESTAPSSLDIDLNYQRLWARYKGFENQL